MGAYASTRLLTPDEAAGLLGPELSQRVEEGFSRLSVNANDGGRGDGIDQRTFHRHVLEAFPAMPVVVVRTLFDAIDATAGGRREGGRGQGLVVMDDFMCMAAVLLMGSAEQRMKLAFRVYEVMGLRRLEGGGGRGGGRGGGGDSLFRGQVSSALLGNQGNLMGLGGGGRGAEGGCVDARDVETLLRAVYGPGVSAVEAAVRVVFGHPSSSPAAPASSQSLDFPAFSLRLAGAGWAQRVVVGWLATVLAQVLTQEPPASMVALEMKYHPEREMRQLAERYQVGGREGGR